MDSSTRYKQKLHVHYNEYPDHTPTVATYKATVITKGLLPYDHIVCLVNTAGDYTDFDTVPEAQDKWLDKIGLDYIFYPSLSKYWGESGEIYAFNLCYELPHEFSDSHVSDDKIELKYDEQLELIIQAAEKIAEAIPYALVRVSEKAACWGNHCLEIGFPYPCRAKDIKKADSILEERFDYVWRIGQGQQADGCGGGDPQGNIILHEITIDDIVAQMDGRFDEEEARIAFQNIYDSNTIEAKKLLERLMPAIIKAAKEARE